ncbi:MAG TPA: hypothetical protein VIV60_34420, partial [Polyangiaceae bacterium]
MIGGLEGSPQPLETGTIPGQHATGKPETWSVLVPNRGAVDMSTDDLVLALRSGVIDVHSRVWREGQVAWKPLNEIEALRSALQSAGVYANAASQVQPNRSITAQISEPPATTRLPLGNAVVKPVEGTAFEDEVTKIAQSPWNVLDVGARATADLALAAAAASSGSSAPVEAMTDVVG